MKYERYELQESLAIRKLITFYYKEMPKDYFFSGERHDFWEMLYVDKGEWEVSLDGKQNVHLEQGDLIFYGPNEFHVGGAAQKSSPNVIIVTFECDSEAMDFFLENRKFRLDDKERSILSQLVKAGKESFDPPIDSPDMRTPHRRPNAPFGSEQLIRNHLENLLIHLVRRGETAISKEKPGSTVKENKDSEIAGDMIAYLKANLGANMTIEQLCQQFNVSRTQLKTAFKHTTGHSVLEYFNQLKIERAKTLIREEKLNYTEISEMLGYSSIHYFSRQFKKLTNMTPTEYARSVKLRSTLERDSCFGMFP